MEKQKSWRDPSIYLEHLHVAEEIVDLEYTREIIHRAGLPVTVVPYNKTPSIIQTEFHPGLETAKKHLFLCKNKGAFFKPCPGTQEYQCCDYHVLNIGMNCPIDCVYCILQAYLNQPWITAFVNDNDLFQELDDTLRQNPQKFYRIGTGEFSDSLALERITGISQKLVEKLSRYPNVMLELKTKSSYIDTLQYADHRGKTVLSWSLNSPAIIKNQEIRSATLIERLDGARRAASWGYHLGFHFDPIIYHHDWQAGYEETINLLFQHIDPQAIAWISLGALRYLPSLKTISTQRFKHSRIFYQEFITGLDGKLRYFRSQREAMYRHIYTLLRDKISNDTCIYFCMESDEIWKSVFGYIPENKGGIPAMLDNAAKKAIAKY